MIKRNQKNWDYAENKLQHTYIHIHEISYFQILQNGNAHIAHILVSFASPMKNNDTKIKEHFVRKY